MKVLYCIDSLTSSGGTERVLTTKLNWYARRDDVDVTVISVKEEGEPFFALNEKVRRIILDVKQRDNVNYKTKLAEVLTTFKPDVTVAVAGMSVGALPCMNDGSKKILEFHYTRNYLVNFVKGIDKIKFRWLHLLKMHYLQWKLTRQASKYDLFVGLTKRDIGLWGNPANMSYVYNPLSFRSVRKSTCLNKVIISVGSWTPSKGMDQLLEAFGPLANNYPDWKIELYGAGQDENRLQEIISRYGMEKQITLNAPVKDIGNKLIEASIYAFPSRSDGFGLVITEAMECGLPTVAMDCQCGPCEIVTPQTGIVVPNGDIEAFRSALKRLMDNPDERIGMGKAASSEVVRFYPENIMPQWLELFQKIAPKA